MKRNHVTTLASITLALATSGAFAQSTQGPDFSPMKPGNYEELRSQSAPLSEQRPSAPSNEAPATPPQNSMLDAYESSAVPGDAVSAAPYEGPSRPRLSVVAPRQSTIGNGLFDRRGPNDFGS